MSKKGKRLREFEKNNREFNISEAQRQRQERHRATRERKSSKVLAAESPTFRARPTSEEKRRIK